MRSACARSRRATWRSRRSGRRRSARPTSPRRSTSSAPIRACIRRRTSLAQAAATSPGSCRRPPVLRPSPQGRLHGQGDPRTAPFTTIAYYNDPTDGSKPGEFFVNTFKPEARPRYELAALAAPRVDPRASPPDDRVSSATCRSSGARRAPPPSSRAGPSTPSGSPRRWASTRTTSIGSARRAATCRRGARLVVDTGLHRDGLDAARTGRGVHAREHTAITPENIKNEVDRYITTLGQALAYKVGQLDPGAPRDGREGAGLASTCAPSTTRSSAAAP